jgi:hypothetical protein
VNTRGVDTFRCLAVEKKKGPRSPTRNELQSLEPIIVKIKQWILTGANERNTLLFRKTLEILQNIQSLFLIFLIGYQLFVFEVVQDLETLFNSFMLAIKRLPPRHAGSWSN